MLSIRTGNIFWYVLQKRAKVLSQFIRTHKSTHFNEKTPNFARSGLDFGMWLNEYFGFESWPLRQCHADEFAVSCIEIDGFCQECPYLLPALYVSLCALNCEGIRDYHAWQTSQWVLTVTYFNFDSDYLTGPLKHFCIKWLMKGFFFLFTRQAKTSHEVKFSYKLASLSRGEPKAYHFQRANCGLKVQTIPGIQ